MVGFGKSYWLVPLEIFFLELSSYSWRQVTDWMVTGCSAGCSNPQAWPLSQNWAIAECPLCSAWAVSSCCTVRQLQPFLLLLCNGLVKPAHLVGVCTCKLWSVRQVLSCHLCSDWMQQKTFCKQRRKTYRPPRNVTICNRVQQCGMVKQPSSTHYTLVKVRACAFPEGGEGSKILSVLFS